MTIDNKELVTKMGFIAKAISKDITREYLTVFKCEEDRVISTDGKRLHILSVSKEDIEFMGLEVETYYKMIVANSKMVSFEKTLLAMSDIVYPNIDKVIPTIEPLTTLDIVLGNKKKPDTYKEVSRLIKAMSEDKTINFEYLFDLPQMCYNVEIHPTVTVFNNESLGLKAVIANIAY